MKPHNELSPAEVERLAILIEECGEVIQAASKVLRFGWRGESGQDNKKDLVSELGDVQAAIDLMTTCEDFHADTMWASTNRKGDKLKLKGIMFHQPWNEEAARKEYRDRHKNDPSLPCDECGGDKRTGHQRLCETLYEKKTKQRKDQDSSNNG